MKFIAFFVTGRFFLSNVESSAVRIHLESIILSSKKVKYFQIVFFWDHSVVCKEILYHINWRIKYFHESRSWEIVNKMRNHQKMIPNYFRVWFNLLYPISGNSRRESFSKLTVAQTLISACVWHAACRSEIKHNQFQKIFISFILMLWQGYCCHIWTCLHSKNIVAKQFDRMDFRNSNIWFKGRLR